MLIEQEDPEDNINEFIEEDNELENINKSISSEENTNERLSKKSLDKTEGLLLNQNENFTKRIGRWDDDYK